MIKGVKRKLPKSMFGASKKIKPFKREEIDRFETEYKDKKSNQTSP